MKNSKFVFDKITKLIEQGLISSKDLANEIMMILKSKRDEFVFKMKLVSKDEFEVLSKELKSWKKNLGDRDQKKRKKLNGQKNPNFKSIQFRFF